MESQSYYQYLPSAGVWKCPSKGLLSKLHPVADCSKSSHILKRLVGNAFPSLPGKALHFWIWNIRLCI